jgi:glycine cleavage system H protein
MSKPNPTDRKYSEEHEWVFDNKDGTITIGITDYAQEQLTDIVFVELPDVGKTVKQFEPMAVVESVKSVSDIYAPISGAVLDVNRELEEEPELVNKDPFGKGWIAKMHMDDPAELNALLDAAAYDELIQGDAG